MIDLRLLRENPDLVRASQRARGDDESLVDALLAADEARRAAIALADNLRAEQKSVSQSVRSASAEDRPAILEKAKALAAAVKEAEAAQTAAERRSFALATTRRALVRTRTSPAPVPRTNDRNGSAAR